MKNKFLEILKDAYPEGFDPQKHSGAMLQLWREEMAFALEAAAQPLRALDAVPRCSRCGNTKDVHPSGACHVFDPRQ